ncbi:MAG: ABC transporter permease [Vulcanimicrobiota bacterium]
MNSSYIQINNLELIFAAALMILTLVLNYIARAKLAKDILSGTLRCFVQLMLIGYILKFIFSAGKWYWIILALSIMILVAGFEAVRREEKRGPMTYVYVTLAISTATVFIMSIGAGIILKIKPWFNPQYIIPMMGMLVGNAMNGAALLINRLSSEITQNRELIEAKLSLGATSREAADRYIKEAIRSSMIPTINALMITGLVSLPGMMTGQIIAGANPLDSVRYQITIMYMISACNSITIFALGFVAFKQYFTRNHQVKLEILRKNNKE